MLPNDALKTIDTQAAAMRWTEWPEGSDGETLKPVATVVLSQASLMKIAPVAWLWPGWLARGKFHVLAGAPGTGKTTIAMSVAAVCSISGRFPDGTPCRGGNVLIWTGEDDPADTLIPRLVASGADLSRIYFIQGTTERGQLRSFDPASDMGMLLEQARSIGSIALLVVDPVVSAVSGDGHKAGDVRRGLQPLVDLALSLGCAALGITHFSKGTSGRDPLERVTGSQAFGALARVVIVAAKDVAAIDDAPARRFISRAKSNIGPDGGGFDYTLAQTEISGHPGLIASYVTWGSAIEGTARELLGAADVNDDEDVREGADAVAFLQSLLVEGPVSVRQIKADATGAGYAWRTIERAKKKAGVTAQKDGARGGWFWAIESQGRQDRQDRHVLRVAALPVTVAALGEAGHGAESASPNDEAAEVF